MARRPKFEHVLSREDLEKYRLQLERLSPHGLGGLYQTVHAQCRFDGKKVPEAASIQQLVTVWKELRKFYKQTLRS